MLKSFCMKHFFCFSSSTIFLTVFVCFSACSIAGVAKQDLDFVTSNSPVLIRIIFVAFIALMNNCLPRNEFPRLKDVLELGQCGSRPVLEERKVLEKVYEFVLIFDLDFLQNALVYILADDCEMTICEAGDSRQPWLVVDQG